MRVACAAGIASLHVSPDETTTMKIDCDESVYLADIGSFEYLFLDRHRNGGDELADRFQRHQRAKPIRATAAVYSLPFDGTVARTDPAVLAGPWRAGHFANDPIVRHHFPATADCPLCTKVDIGAPGPDMNVWHKNDGGVLLSIRVKPGARRNAIEGFHNFADGARALEISVNAAPEKGKANAAAIAVLAKQFGFAKSALGVVSGTKGRTKQILISGDPDLVSDLLAAGLAEFSEG